MAEATEKYRDVGVAQRIYSMYYDACNSEWLELSWNGTSWLVEAKANGFGCVRPITVTAKVLYS